MLLWQRWLAIVQRYGTVESDGKEPPAGPNRETSLRRGLDILIALGGDEAIEHGGLGVTRIAELLDRDKSQVSRTLKTLAEFGLVERDPESRAYWLGWQVFALAHLAGEQRLLDRARPLLIRLVETLSERAHLTVLQGAEALTVLSESPRHAVQAVGWVGRLVPAYCSSAGRALMLGHTRDDLERLFADVEFQRLAPNTVRSVAQLAKRVEEARELGYVIADEEFEAGLVSVAAPVRNPQGRIVAALNVSGPRFRFIHKVDEAGEQLLAAAGELAVALGVPEVRRPAVVERR
jgi:IclR family KDG regulon transcriptional repressor